ncbi:MAG: hypothetical protein WC055_00990 [Melioribacteraceae bacterium]
MKPTIIIEKNKKFFRSSDVNYDFNMENGNTKVWGEKKSIDPEYSPYGPFILDLEASSICSFGCQHCYKSNTSNGKHMLFDTFKSIIDKFPKYNNIHLLTQTAFGIGDVDVSDELWKMMEYCRENTIIPNVTINGDRLTDDIVDKLSSLCGAVAVSRYADKNICYNAVKRLTDKGMTQINVHMLISEETYRQTLETLRDIKSDPRLEKLNAIVFLSLKQKGRGTNYHKLSTEKFSHIVKYCLFNDIRYGCDSCGANKLMDMFRDWGILKHFEQSIEPCESASFSSYIDVNGVFHPCSFSNKETDGIDMAGVNNFLEDLWFKKSTCIERNKIQGNNRSCPYFDV